MQHSIHYKEKFNVTLPPPRFVHRGSFPMVYLVTFRRCDYNARPGIHEESRGSFVVRAMTGSKSEIRRRAAEYLQIPEIDITVL